MKKKLRNYSDFAKNTITTFIAEARFQHTKNKEI